LIMQESPSAYYIHCFAHQLQLVLVAVAKGNNDYVWFFDQVSLLLNIVGVSCKRHGMLRDARIENLMRAQIKRWGWLGPVTLGGALITRLYATSLLSVCNIIAICMQHHCYVSYNP
jgi:hypothetical protein